MKLALVDHFSRGFLAMLYTDEFIVWEDNGDVIDTIYTLHSGEEVPHSHLNYWLEVNTEDGLHYAIIALKEYKMEHLIPELEDKFYEYIY